jgi:Ni,Fe-hydrogenase maturation factor
MRTLLIAVGNRLRRDDGVAHTVLGQLGSIRDVDSRAFLQLSPEVAQDIAAYNAVVFIDSDASAVEPIIQSIDRLPSSPVFSHLSSPAEVVALSRALFGFGGRALLCRIPVCDLSTGEGLSLQTRACAAQAVVKLENLLGEWSTKARK